jgi:CRISPR-associated protein Cas1
MVVFPCWLALGVPLAILHTHRRGLFLLERAHVHVAEGRAVHAEAEGDAPIRRSWNIPSLNTSALVLGQGCSITQPAVRRLSEDGVLIAFSGTDGTPLVCASQSYRPPEALQAWISKWPDPAWRLKAAKHLQRARIDAVRSCWAALRAEGFLGVPDAILSVYEAGLEAAGGVAAMTGHEGGCTKALYLEAARATGVAWSGRVHREAPDFANHYLDHGNYLAYGLAGIALWAVGLPPSLPVVHGRSNAGGLVFDLADVIKDAVVLPTAFQCAAEPAMKPNEVRRRIVERMYDATCLDRNGCVGLLFKVVDELVRLPAGSQP